MISKAGLMYKITSFSEKIKVILFLKHINMDYCFDITLKTRNFYKNILDNYSLEQLNKIPEGFNNNIFWNIKHVIVTQQLLVYKLSGLPMHVTDEEVEAYQKGSKPSSNAYESDLELLKEQLYSTLEQTKRDYKNGFFKKYNEYTVTTKSTLTCVEEALEFNNFHEGIHLGYLLAIMRTI